MEKKCFIEKFAALAKKNGFSFLYGVWWKESSKSIIMLELQKSNFSNLFYLNIKVFVHGVLQKQHVKCKKLVNAPVYCCFTRPPGKFHVYLDLESSIEDNEREKGVSMLFTDFIGPFSIKALSVNGVCELIDENELLSSPSLRNELQDILKMELKSSNTLD